MRRECMFCHNAYPRVAAGSDAGGAPQVFPHEMPEDTGCQRCHGPAAEHVEIAETDMGNMARVRMSIVNPGRLPKQLRDDVCDQCHLQPSVALAGVRRFGRGEYSYQAGQSLP